MLRAKKKWKPETTVPSADNSSIFGLDYDLPEQRDKKQKAFE